MSVLDNYGGHPFDEVFDHVLPCYGLKDVEAVLELTDRCAAVIWGGADISPTIYGQKPNARTGAGEDLSERDYHEVTIAKKCIESGIPVIGICRGAQMMCAISGGTLVQHVEGHAVGRYHGITTNKGLELNVPSLHHQMMYPWKSDGVTPAFDFDFIAWSTDKQSDIYLGEPLETTEGATGDDAKYGCKMLKVEKEPEIIWIPGTKSLCIQSHPEFIMKMDHPFVKYCNELVKELILK